METTIRIDGREYTLLGQQRSGAAIYRGKDSYVRIGPARVIAPDLALHRAMEAEHYPVAHILAEGMLGADQYFVEESLGTHSFRTLFQEDCEQTGVISDANFLTFTRVMKRLLDAEMRALESEWDTTDFAAGIRLPVLMSELPRHADALYARFEAALPRIKKIPGTLTHGDCNPANMYAGGIIDLEDSFRGPLGYDCVSAISTIDWTPRTKQYEFHAQYSFTDEQKKQYLQTLSKKAGKVRLDLTALYEDFAFCRAVWLCTGMGAWPRLQQWRYEKLVDTYLS